MLFVDYRLKSHENLA